MMNFKKKLFLSSLSKAFSSQIQVQLPASQFWKLDNTDIPSGIVTNSEELIRYYKELWTMRRMEVVCDGLYKNREIRGFLHLYDGQESVALGIEEALTKQDHIITAYRVHCQALKRGISLYQIFAEMLQKRDGSSKGKGGSMHYYNAKENFWGGNGIVGAQCPVGTGVAFGLKYKKQPNVSVTMYGDGCANQGQLFEASNMAYLWKLPCIYLCENNLYGMGTSIERASANTNFYQRLDPVPGIQVEAYNVFNVREVMKFAKKYAIENGPICLEMKTYRYHGHSMSDPGDSYRKREEISNTRKTRDPVDFIKNLILEHKVASEKELSDISKAINQEIDEVVEKARAAKEPEKEDMLSDILKEEPTYIRGPIYDESMFREGKY